MGQSRSHLGCGANRHGPFAALDLSWTPRGIEGLFTRVPHFKAHGGQGWVSHRQSGDRLRRRRLRLTPLFRASRSLRGGGGGGVPRERRSEAVCLRAADVAIGWTRLLRARASLQGQRRAQWTRGGHAARRHRLPDDRFGRSLARAFRAARGGGLFPQPGGRNPRDRLLWLPHPQQSRRCHVGACLRQCARRRRLPACRRARDQRGAGLVAGGSGGTGFPGSCLRRSLCRVLHRARSGQRPLSLEPLPPRSAPHQCAKRPPFLPADTLWRRWNRRASGRRRLWELWQRRHSLLSAPVAKPIKAALFGRRLLLQERFAVAAFPAIILSRSGGFVEEVFGLGPCAPEGGAHWRGAMATGSLTQMFEEIAAGLKAGDEEIYGWLRDQLKECGGSEIAVELAMGVIAKLLPEDAQTGMIVASQQARRWAH